MKELIKQYWRAIIAVLFVVAMLFYMSADYTARTTAARKASDKAISAPAALIVSQDKAVERIYTDAKKEARRKNEEIKSAVKTLSPDAVARSLDALLGEYRRERGD